MDTINYINVNGTTYEISGNIDTSTLMKVATTLSNAPTVTTLSHNGILFVVGDIVRVADQSSTTGYSFYRLHKIENNQALWAKLDTGTIDDSATITVSMNSNLNETFTSGSATISYIYNNNTVTDTQSGATATFTNIPAGVSYTISFGTVNGYATPSNITGTTATFGRPSHTVTYNTELVSVTTELNGVTLYVNNVEYTEPVKIAWGESYTVTGSSISGYNVSSDTYTASLKTRNVEVVYEEAKSYIFVMTSSGEEVPVSLATTNCIGVVVRDTDKGVAFLIPKRDGLYDYIEYWDSLYSTNLIISGIIATDDKAIARTDYNGVANTSIMRLKQSGCEAAKYCYNQTITINGTTKHGYLGGCGEWSIVAQNKLDILNACTAIGSKAFNYYYRTSTQYSSDASLAWNLNWDSGDLITFDKGVNNTVACQVIPFYALS